MERMAAVAVRRPVLVSMVVLAALVVGGVALTRTGLDLLPDIEIPVLAIVTVYPGAGPEAVETRVASPIESSIATVAGVTRTTSISLENLSLVTAELAWGTDLALAVSDFDEILQRLRLTLPSGIQPPLILRLDPTQLPIAMYAVTDSEDASDLSAITEKSRRLLVPLLQRVEGVGRVIVSGGTEDRLEVRYDPDALASAGISPSQLAQMLTYQNVEVPAGTLTQDGVRYALRAGSSFRSLDDIRNLPITILKPGQGGVALIPRVVTVADVATVDLVHQSPEGYARVNGKPSVLISVLKESGQNTVTVARRIEQALDGGRENLEGLQLVPVFQQSEFITKSLFSVTRDGAVGGLLAVALLYLFLADVLSTLSIAIAIPISIVATLALIFLNGMTLNLMSLGGLGLGIGMLVDNSIVVLESIFRHAQQGEAPDVAARRGTAEVGLAISASTFTTIVVFLPVVFVGGMAGRIFRELALTVSFSLLTSLLVALTVVPMLAARLRLADQTGLVEGVQELAARRHRAAWFEPVRRAYAAALRRSLHHRWIVLGSVVAIAVAALAVYPRLGVEFLAPVDTGELGVGVEMPPGAPLERTDALVRQVEEIVAGVPYVQVVSAQVGSAGSGDLLSVLGGETPSSGNVFVLLKPRAERRAGAEVAADVRARLAGIAASTPGARVRVTESPSFGVLSQLLADRVTLNVEGSDPGSLRSVAEELRERLEKTPGFINVNTSLQAQEPAIALRVNPGKALTGGLLAAQVGAGVRDARLGAEAGQFQPGGERSVPIIVRADPSRAATLESVLQLPVSGLSLPGMPSSRVQLGRVVTPETTDQPAAISHRDGRRVVTVTADVDGVRLGEAGRRAEEIIRTMNVPAGSSVTLAGIHELMNEAFGDLWLALVLAVVLVYMVMAAQFESLLDPLIVMLTVPLGLAGAIFSLALTGLAVGITVIVGGIALAGIVVNNGIVMIDYTNQLIGRRASLVDAVVEASAVRLRPVLMTALTTILGLIPLTLAWGEATELEVPLAVTVVGGMTLATLLTLFAVPAAKLTAGEIQARLARRARSASSTPALRTVAWGAVIPWALAAGMAASALLTASEAARAAGTLRWQRQATSVAVGGSTSVDGADPTAVSEGWVAVGWRGRIAGGALDGTVLRTALRAGATVSSPEGARPWQLAAGLSATRRRLLAGAGLTSQSAEAWIAWTPSSVAAPAAHGMVRLAGSLAVGNIAGSARAWAVAQVFDPSGLWVADTEAVAPWVAAAGSLPGSTGVSFEARLRLSRRLTLSSDLGWEAPAGSGAAAFDHPDRGYHAGAALTWQGSPSTVVFLGGGARFSPATGMDRVVPQWRGGAWQRLGPLSLSVALAGDLRPVNESAGARSAPLSGALSARIALDRQTSLSLVATVPSWRPPLAGLLPAGPGADAAVSLESTLPEAFGAGRRVQALVGWQAVARRAHAGLALSW